MGRGKEGAVPDEGVERGNGGGRLSAAVTGSGGGGEGRTTAGTGGGKPGATGVFTLLSARGSGAFSFSLNFGGSIAGSEAEGGGATTGSWLAIASGTALGGESVTTRGFNEMVRGAGGTDDGASIGVATFSAGGTGSSFGRSRSFGGSDCVVGLSAAGGTDSIGAGVELSASGRARGFNRRGGGVGSSLMICGGLQFGTKHETKKIHSRSNFRMPTFTGL